MMGGSYVELNYANTKLTSLSRVNVLCNLSEWEET